MLEPEEREMDIPGLDRADKHLMHLTFERSFLSGPHSDPSIMDVRWFVTPEGHLRGRAYFGPGAQGPPGHAHGGSMAAVMDEALGSACWIAGHTVLAAELTTRFLAKLPLDRVYEIEAEIERVDGRKIYPVGRIKDSSGTIYAEATGLFITVDFAKNLGGV